MEERGKTFLEIVPFKEPRPNSFIVLESDLEIKDFDNSKFIFTDITFDATNQVNYNFFFSIIFFKGPNYCG